MYPTSSSLIMFLRISISHFIFYLLDLSWLRGKLKFLTFVSSFILFYEYMDTVIINAYIFITILSSLWIISFGNKKPILPFILLFLSLIPLLYKNRNFNFCYLYLPVNLVCLLSIFVIILSSAISYKHVTQTWIIFHQMSQTPL